MKIININHKEYQSIKLILAKSKKGGYITLPKWLINKNVLIRIPNAGEEIKKVNKNAVVSFPNIMVGLKVSVQYY